jgi:hypothetical protein
MISKCMAFVFAALVLANCCASGNGCGGPTGGPVAWDGLGAAPVQDTQAEDKPVQGTQPVDLRPNQPAGKIRAKKQDALAAAPQDGNLQPRDTFKDRFNDRSSDKSSDTYDRQQAADQADERRLKQKLIICRDCGATQPGRDDAAADAAR